MSSSLPSSAPPSQAPTRRLLPRQPAPSLFPHPSSTQQPPPASPTQNGSIRSTPAPPVLCPSRRPHCRRPNAPARGPRTLEAFWQCHRTNPDDPLPPRYQRTQPITYEPIKPQAMRTHLPSCTRKIKRPKSKKCARSRCAGQRKSLHRNRRQGRI
ncbi:hypothetical protein BCR44DRAFT_1444910, partial [Catenaria anguillulae PL171]